MTTKKQFSITRTVLLLILVVSSFELISQTSSRPVINQKQEHILKSQINGTTYYLNISLPQHYSLKNTTRYPVLYLLDAGFGFPIAHSARNGLDIFGELEGIIIVGIGYEWEQSTIPWITNRWKDYSPTHNADIDSIFTKQYSLPEGSLLSGGGSVFLNVISNEIIPFIDKEYKTTTDRGISGHSLGGLFVGYCLFSAPNLFNKYGISSPSFWWDNKKMFKMEKAFSEHNQSLEVQIFMCVGGMEGESRTSELTAFSDSLRSRKYKGLNFTTHIFEGETHMSVIPAEISRTLRVLYGVKKE